MEKRSLVFLSILFIVGLYSCSRKSHPAKTVETTSSSETVTNKVDSATAGIDSAAAAKKVVAKRKEKVAIPKVIVVSDSAAHKSVDGRYYYDMLGHRYWRSSKDGKYYLFNKSMYNDPDFKKPG
ncbi:MAG: hypothetical protein M3R50_06775 [Bacteroidota bacterium]|nr:hypothetical protein [Bacteroidota bacterium]